MSGLQIMLLVVAVLVVVAAAVVVRIRQRRTGRVLIAEVSGESHRLGDPS